MCGHGEYPCNRSSTAADRLVVGARHRTGSQRRRRRCAGSAAFRPNGETGGARTSRRGPAGRAKDFSTAAPHVGTTPDVGAATGCTSTAHGSAAPRRAVSTDGRAPACGTAAAGDAVAGGPATARSRPARSRRAAAGR